jgi:two-component system, chemotaxis family, protein-glutamate methylesterase/glutaminase
MGTTPIGHDLIVMGASAGGVQAFRQLLKHLSPDLSAAVLIVQHTAPQGPGFLANVLGRDAALPVKEAISGEIIRQGRVYVAPPDQHLIVQGPRLQLSRGPRENRQRPAIDLLFRSAAQSYGPRTVGVVLTGYLDDGTAGLAMIKVHGGIAVVQTPDEAEAPGMPRSVMRYVPVDHCLPLAEIGPLLMRLTKERAVRANGKPNHYVEKTVMAPEEMTGKFGSPTGFVCPECDGALWETTTGEALQFRCHVGHLYSPESLLADHDDGLEAALWSVVRTLDEQAALLRRLARRKAPLESKEPDLPARARKCERQAEAIRALFEKKGATQRSQHRTRPG